MAESIPFDSSFPECKLELYFTKEELEEMDLDEKVLCFNSMNNYFFFKSLGVDQPMPEFMIKKELDPIKIKIKIDEYYYSGISPLAMEAPLKNKLLHMYKKESLSEEQFNLLPDIPRVSEDDKSGEDYNPVMIVYMKKEEEEDEEEEEKKKEEEEKKKEEKGDLEENVNKFIDTASPMAARSVPDGLVLKDSDLAEGLSGIFSFKQVSKGTVFGPYVGKRCFNRQDSYNHGYHWDIFVNNKFHHCIDGRNANRSNWMRYVNLAASDDLQNLEAFQQGYEIFYKVTRDIPAHTEMLVWHADNYNQDIFQQHPNIRFPQDESLVEIMSIIKKWEDKNNTIKNNNNLNNNIQNNNNVNKRVMLKYSNDNFKCDVPGCDCFSVLRKHKRTHTRNKTYKCDVCHSIFTNKGYLLKHKRIHKEDEPYKCDVCDIIFTNNTHLVKHKLIHKEFYKCDVCDIVFSRSGYLIRHIATHSNCKCKICLINFASKSALKIHERTHKALKPFKCDVCNTSYTVKSKLKVHKRIHTKGKPYQCDVCDKSFVVCSSLISHKRTHTGETPFMCDVCGDTFPRICNLKSHIRKVHNL